MSRIAIIDDVLPNALLLKGYASKLGGVDASVFTNPRLGLDWCLEHEPDLIMLDFHMPEMDGAEFLGQLRQNERLKDVPVVVITGAENRDTLYRALDAGANDFLRKPVDDIELLARARNMLNLRARQLELADANDRLYRLATTDSLTGVYNRRHFLSRVDDEIARVRRHGRPGCVVMVDADHFKRVNDQHGHDAGDRVLQALAATLRHTIRATDCVGRLGGEEFAVLLVETGVDDARAVCARLLEQVRAIRVGAGSAAILVTVSAGLTAMRPEDANAAAALKRADDALYKAKKDGRDRIEVG